MGGRCAENIIFKDSNTGAGNDIAVATDIAKKMVCEWGMSETIGPLKIGRANEEVFLGKDYNENRNTRIMFQNLSITKFQSLLRTQNPMLLILLIQTLINFMISLTLY